MAYDPALSLSTRPDGVEQGATDGTCEVGGGASPAWPRAQPRPSSPTDNSRLLASPFLSTNERQALTEVMSATRSIAPATDLVREGERAESLFLIKDGWACRYVTTWEGARQFPALLVPGDVGNLDSLMFERLDYGVRTLTAATVTTLPRVKALALVAQHPGIARAFTWLAMVENTTLSQWAVSLGRRSARERVAHLLCELSVRLNAEQGGASSSFAFPLTQEHIADALGLTSVHVNRMIQHLRGDGLIATVERTMTIPDVARLRRAAGFDEGYLHVDTVGEARSVNEHPAR